MDSFLQLYRPSLIHRPLQSSKLNYSFHKEALNYIKSFSRVYSKVSSLSVYAISYVTILPKAKHVLIHSD